ncbi:Chromatin binding [Sarracenia purpurea var. burkii]
MTTAKLITTYLEPLPTARLFVYLVISPRSHREPLQTRILNLPRVQLQRVEQLLVSTTNAVTADAASTTTINGATGDSSNDGKIETILQVEEFIDRFVTFECYFTLVDFRITAKLLKDVETNPLRVLIGVGGLFRAGQLSAVRPPDLYGIKLDGERGHRTHIYTKEEILRDAVLEVEVKYPLTNGTRVCAFWSSQYLSLYPGFVTSDESEDEYFTSVEFDDGDSGRISIKDVRLLPKNFSISRRPLTDDLNTRTLHHSNHDHHKRKTSNIGS